MLIDVIFSFRNEEKNLIELVNRVDKAFKSLVDVSYRLIFVNDCSTDTSLNVLIELKNDYPILILNTSRKFGYIGGVLAGFAYAKGDAVIYMDSDLQDPPEIIPQLINKFQEGFDVVHTRRIKREQIGRMQKFLTKYAYRIIEFFSEIKFPPDSGDFKLISSRALKEILNIREYDPYIRGLSVWVGFKQASVDYIRDSRYRGDTHFPIFGSAAPYREFIRAIASNSVLPLYIAIYLGFLAILVSVSIFLYAIYTKIFGLAIPGSSGILMVVSFFGGAVLITNGVIGIYLGRIYNAVKGRPNYIIDKVL